MKHESMKLTSSYNNQLYIKVMNGHFATNHSHINQYIDMTTLKVRGTMAAAAAQTMGTEDAISLKGQRHLGPCRCQIHGNRIYGINHR